MYPQGDTYLITNSRGRAYLVTNSKMTDSMGNGPSSLLLHISESNKQEENIPKVKLRASSQHGSKATGNNNKSHYRGNITPVRWNKEIFKMKERERQ